MKRWLLLLVVMLLLASPAVATFRISNPNMQFHTTDGANISFADTTSLNAVQWGGTYLNLTINSSSVRFNGTAADLRLSKVSYVADRLNFTGEATSGTMGVQATMNVSNAPYKLNVDGSQNQLILSSASKDVSYAYSSWSSHAFEIFQDTALPVLSLTSPAAYVVIVSGVSSVFTTATTQPIASYFWTVDGAAVTGTGTYSRSWSEGLHHVKVYGSNANGNSNTLEWRMSVSPLLAVTPIPTVNESRYTLLKNNTQNFNTQALFENSILPYTDIIGSAFWLFVWLIISVAYWVRQRQITMPSVIGLIFGGVIVGTLPEEYQLYAKGFIAIGILATLYFLSTKRND